MKFILFVEGKTERLSTGFVKRWLDARLSERVAVKPVMFEGVSDYCGSIAKKAQLRLSSSDSADIIAGIGLLDAYGLDGALKLPSGTSAVHPRCAWAKRYLETAVGHPKFRQHFAIHEVEAWLLSDGQIFPPEVSSRLPAKISSPETVDLNERPARLLEKVYREALSRRYKKAVDGPDLFQSLDPDIAYAKCPALKTMLDDMLVLARGAGL